MCSEILIQGLVSEINPNKKVIKKKMQQQQQNKMKQKINESSRDEMRSQKLSKASSHK